MKRITRMVLLASSALVVLSCAGAPEPAPEPPKTAETPEVADPASQRQEAENLREEIAEYQLSQYAEAEFEDAEEAYNRGIEQYGKDNEAATEALETAVAGFRTVRTTGFLELVEIRRSRAEDQMQAASDVKADVAAADLFLDATYALSEADGAVDNEEYSQALAFYDDASDQFGEAATVAVAKRAEAERAMQEAQESRRNLDSRVEELEGEAREDLESEGEEE